MDNFSRTDMKCVGKMKSTAVAQKKNCFDLSLGHVSITILFRVLGFKKVSELGRTAGRLGGGGGHADVWIGPIAPVALPPAYVLVNYEGGQYLAHNTPRSKSMTPYSNLFVFFFKSGSSGIHFLIGFLDVIDFVVFSLLMSRDFSVLRIFRGRRGGKTPSYGNISLLLRKEIQSRPFHPFI